MLQEQAGAILRSYHAALTACIDDTRQAIAEDNAQRAAHIQTLAMTLGRLSDDTIAQIDRQVIALSTRIREAEARLF